MIVESLIGLQREQTPSNQHICLWEMNLILGFCQTGPQHNIEPQKLSMKSQ